MNQLLKNLTLIFQIVLVIFISACSNPKPTQNNDDNNIFEQSGAIGETGGTIQITDTESPLYSCTVEIPEGALTSQTTITIDTVKQTYYFEGDSTVNFVSLEPSGTIFEKPVNITIPYKTGSDINNLNMYYFDEEKFLWKKLPLIKRDADNNTITAQTNHFSVFVVDGSNVQFDVTGYQYDAQKMCAQVKLVNPLKYMYTDLSTFLATGALNMEELTIKQPFEVKAWFEVILKEKKDYWFDPDVESKIISYGIHSTDGSSYEVRAKDGEGTVLLETSRKYLNIEAVGNYYSAEPILFMFNTEIDYAKEYYFEVTLYYVDSWGWIINSGGFWGTQGYFVSTYDTAQKFAAMDHAPDKDNDGIIDSYDETTGGAPDVNITSPSSGHTYTQGELLYFSGSASDDEDGNLTGNSLVWTSDKDGQIGVGTYLSLVNNLSANPHIITLTATDSDNNKSSKNVSIIVNAKPIISITQPANRQHFTIGDNVTIQANASDTDGSVTKVKFYAKNIYLGEDTSSPYQKIWDTNGLSKDGYGITVIAYDNDNAESQDEIIVYLDDPANQAPTVSITQPANNQHFTIGENVTIQANASDADGSVSKVKFYVNGTYKGEDTSSPYQYSWNTSGLSAGSYTLKSTAVDNDNAETSSQITVHLDEPANQTPTITITQPADGQHFTIGENVTIQANASDADGSVSKVKFYVNGTYKGEDTSSPYQFSWNTSGLSAGSYILKATAVDNDNAETSAQITVHLDEPANQAPTITITQPSDGQHFTIGDNVTIEADATDTDGTVSKVKFYINDTYKGEDTSSPYQYNWNTSGLSSGSYTLKATSVDNDNAETSAQITIELDEAINSAPTASFTVAPSSGGISTSFSFDASASSDNEDPTSSLEIRWDWENDDVWDTGYSTIKTVSHQYGTIGTKTIKMEVKDTGDLTNSTTNQIIVLETGIINDIDDNVYQTVKIGDQWWMAENLKVTHYRNGDPIPNIVDSTEWYSYRSGAYCSYNNDDENIEVYGLLYNWYAVDDSRNIAPVGWHIPTDEDWKELEVFLGMSHSEANGTNWRGTDEGGKLKETGTTHWRSPNKNATNESGFTAIPGGYRNFDGSFYTYIDAQARFWSSTQKSGQGPWLRTLTYYRSEVYRGYHGSKYGFSIRCVRD